MKIKWTTEKRKLKDLSLLENNPRYITPKGFEKLGKDLDEMGNFRPLITDTEGTILGGNQRYKQLLEKFGEDFEVEVSYPDRELSEEEKKKVIISDNKHRGEDDFEVLGEFYAETIADLGFVDVIESPDSDVEEFEQFDLPEGRVLIVFVFDNKEDRGMVLEKLEQDSNNVKGEVLVKLLEDK